MLVESHFRHRDSMLVVLYATGPLLLSAGAHAARIFHPTLTMLCNNDEYYRFDTLADAHPPFDQADCMKHEFASVPQSIQRLEPWRQALVSIVDEMPRCQPGHGMNLQVFIIQSIFS